MGESVQRLKNFTGKEICSRRLKEEISLTLEL